MIRPQNDRITAPWVCQLQTPRRCDALYRMEGDSPGADREVEFANMHNIPVFFDIDDLNEWLS